MKAAGEKKGKGQEKPGAETTEQNENQEANESVVSKSQKSAKKKVTATKAKKSEEKPAAKKKSSAKKPQAKADAAKPQAKAVAAKKAPAAAGVVNPPEKIAVDEVVSKANEVEETVAEPETPVVKTEKESAPALTANDEKTPTQETEPPQESAQPQQEAGESEEDEKPKFIGCYIPPAMHAEIRIDAKSQIRTVSRHMEWLLLLGLMVRDREIEGLSNIDINHGEFLHLKQALAEYKKKNRNKK